MSDAITVKCPTCDHGRTIIFDHAASRVTGYCPRCSPDELTTFLTPDTKALVAEVVRLRAERDRAVETRENANAATLRAETERDRYRFALIDAANDIEEIAMCRFDSSRRQAIEAALQGIRTALETTDPRRKEASG
jgi:hypothetical protein